MPYVKTEVGQLAFKERSALLSSRQRSAFILFDGIKSTQQVVAATAGLGITELDVGHMVTHGFLKETAPAPAVGAANPGDGSLAAPSPASEPTPASNRTPQERFSQAWPLATQLTATLGLRGFRLNLAVEGAAGYDDLLALFPKIQDAVGVKQCAALEQALKG